ncbi:hypothetical protein [Leptolyngbya sp. FACHB-17]|uniref:hypothetical protein n=1 Tax=unclassified Leptolyngbya TaxID=2650499 RepID=UPI0016807134|nr:hypothetical protein [Leptolyngbya sp. FACHB-17]MBD2079586.1 hypothetical protein [Leptolyngbya sp. FACHB-17]
MVASVGRKKKDADRVNYNISRSIRTAVLKEADKLGWNEIDTIEDLLRYGLAAKAMLKSGDINYAEFVRRMDTIMSEAQEDTEA